MDQNTAWEKSVFGRELTTVERTQFESQFSDLETNIDAINTERSRKIDRTEKIYEGRIPLAIGLGWVGTSFASCYGCGLASGEFESEPDVIAKNRRDEIVADRNNIASQIRHLTVDTSVAVVQYKDMILDAAGNLRKADSTLQQYLATTQPADSTLAKIEANKAMEHNAGWRFGGLTVGAVALVVGSMYLANKLTKRIHNKYGKMLEPIKAKRLELIESYKTPTSTQ